MKSIKRIAAMVLALAILVIGASSVAFAESDYFKTTAELYLRMGPGTEYAPIICMDKGQKMTYIDHSYAEDGRDWFEVKTTSGIRGWCCSDYLTYVSGQTGSKVTIKGGNAFIRSGAGLNYSKKGVAMKGTTMTYTETKTDGRGVVWYHVTLNKINGWVSSAYAKKV